MSIKVGKGQEIIDLQVFQGLLWALKGLKFIEFVLDFESCKCNSFQLEKFVANEEAYTVYIITTVLQFSAINLFFKDWFYLDGWSFYGSDTKYRYRGLYKSQLRFVETLDQYGKNQLDN